MATTNQDTLFHRIGPLLNVYELSDEIDRRVAQGATGTIIGTGPGTIAAGDDPRIVNAQNATQVLAILAAGTAALAGNVTGIVGVNHGGTGAATQADALAALGAYSSSNPAGFQTALQVAALIVSLGAPITSPGFLGVPTAPTPDQSASGNQLATAAFVKTAAGTNALDYVIGLTAPGTTGNSEHLLVYALPHPITLPAGLAGSAALALTAATSSAVFTFAHRQGGVTSTIATFTFAASATTATINVVSIPVLLPGDVLLLTAPSTADATLADIGFTLLGVRQ